MKSVQQYPGEEINTSSIQSNLKHSFFGGFWNIFLGLIACIPIWLATHGYLNVVSVHLDEAVATAATIAFITGVFTGRYLIKTWADEQPEIPVAFVGVMIFIFIVCTFWLFLFPSFDERVPNPLPLLLYWLPFGTLSLVIGAVIKVVSSVNRNKLRAARAIAEISKSELQLLQSKLSPHFLFNTLNNMYGISITKHEMLPALLLKLADLLRYSVYEANDTYAPLKDEIEYINNYIDFEKIRIGDRLVLNLNLPQSIDARIRIAPLLLIIFIENAFKHSKNSADDKIYIDMQLKIRETRIFFTIKNSYSKEQGNDEVIRKQGGLGLVNAYRRLELLYPGEHKLSIQNTGLFYQVDLQLLIK